MLTQATRIVIQMTGMVVLARLIAPEFFGLIAMVLAITGVAEIFRDFGLSQSALRRVDLTHQQRSNLFWLNTASGFVLTLVVFGLSWAVANLYGHPELLVIVQCISPVYLLGGISTQFRIHINVALRFRALAITDLVPPTFATVVAIGIAMQGYPIAALISMQVVAPIVLLILSAILARWLPSRPRRTEGMRELLTFGASFALTQLMSYATRNLDSVFIGKVWGSASLGLYDRAYQFSVAPLMQINAPLSRVAIPVLARVTANKHQFLRALREAQLVQSYVTATGLLVAAGLGTPLMVLLLGKPWEAAGTIFSILAIGSVFRSIQQIAYWMYMTLGLATAQLKLYLVGHPLIVVCLLIGLAWGPIGVATGSLFGWALFWFVSLKWVQHASGINVTPLMTDSLRVLGVIGAPAGLVAYAIATFCPVAPALVVLLGLAGAVLWVGIAGVILPWARRDILKLLQFVRIALNKKK